MCDFFLSILPLVTHYLGDVIDDHYDHYDVRARLE